MVALSEIFESLGTLDLPSADQPALARQQNSAAVELGRVLESDFELAANTLRQRGGQAADRRALVRCFGSVVDGLVNALRSIAEIVCAREGRQPHLLRDKAGEPGAAILQRICISYRIITRYLPGCPLTSLQARRWDELKAALDIRNRVAHPHTPSDLEISDTNIRLITEVARQLIADFETMTAWQASRPLRFVSGESEGKRRRNRRGGSRSRKCHCGSGGKYRSCCGREELAAQK